jgi:site-specific DNA-methyltransferase (adenine-specific)
VTINRSTYIVGDVRDCLAATPDGSVDLVMTSPPFLALRSYLPADHPDKHREIGAEPDPATFLDTLLALTAEWRRVLAPHGSICVELGDTYAGSGGAGGGYADDGLRAGQQAFTGSKRQGNPRNDKQQMAAQGIIGTTSGERAKANPNGWPLPKSLCGIPHLYHLSLAYGRNLLTGEESPAGRWRVRNVVAWCRPNPPVGALGDKFRPATSYMTIATPYGKRYFDLDSVRTEHKHPDDASRARTGHRDAGKVGGDGASNPAGAPPLDYWVIPTAHYSGSHYAVYPPALCDRPIKAMCPQRVCTVCGAPSERITSEPEYLDASGEVVEGMSWPSAVAEGRAAHSAKTDGGVTRTTRTTRTIGWSECECPDDGTKWRPGLVLDPFAGSGTTLMVANELERDAVGFDIDARNATLARQRVDKFMFADFEVYPLSLLGFLAPQIRL